VLRLLNIVLNRRNLGLEHALELLLRNCASLLAHPYLFGMEEKSLNLGIAASATHIGDTQERAGLRTNIAAIVIELGLILQHRLGINIVIIRAESLAGIDEKLLCSNRVHFAGIRD
jgi:hypothetical protein